MSRRYALADRRKFPTGRKILRNPPAGLAVYATMPRVLPLLVIVGVTLAAGCATRSPTTATKLEPKIQAQVGKGLIEPGFTPEMVYLALGKLYVKVNLPRRVVTQFQEVLRWDPQHREAQKLLDEITKGAAKRGR